MTEIQFSAGKIWVFHNNDCDETIAGRPGSPGWHKIGLGRSMSQSGEVGADRSQSDSPPHGGEAGDGVSPSAARRAGDHSYVGSVPFPCLKQAVEDLFPFPPEAEFRYDLMAVPKDVASSMASTTAGGGYQDRGIIGQQIWNAASGLAAGVSTTDSSSTSSAAAHGGSASSRTNSLGAGQQWSKHGNSGPGCMAISSVKIFKKSNVDAPFCGPNGGEPEERSQILICGQNPFLSLYDDFANIDKGGGGAEEYYSGIGQQVGSVVGAAVSWFSSKGWFSGGDSSAEAQSGDNNNVGSASHASGSSAQHPEDGQASSSSARRGARYNPLQQKPRVAAGMLPCTEILCTSFSSLVEMVQY